MASRGETAASTAAWSSTGISGMADDATDRARDVSFAGAQPSPEAGARDAGALAGGGRGGHRGRRALPARLHAGARRRRAEAQRVAAGRVPRGHGPRAGWAIALGRSGPLGLGRDRRRQRPQQFRPTDQTSGNAPRLRRGAQSCRIAPAPAVDPSNAAGPPGRPRSPRRTFMRYLLLIYGPAEGGPSPEEAQAEMP